MNEDVIRIGISEEQVKSEYVRSMPGLYVRRFEVPPLSMVERNES